jgi:signal transduction histidine kinase
LSLVDDILDLTGIEGRGIEIHAERIHIPTLVLACRETVEPLLKSGVVLIADVSDNVGEAHTDKARLRQVLINLLGHAAKMTETGEVKIRATREDPSELVLAVSNTGPSIPTEALETIFDGFHSLTGSGIQHEDTGLGLSISKRLVELLGGTIRVENQVGKGSTFTVQLPMDYRGS